MLLDDALEHRGRAGAVPYALRIDHRDGALLAHAQAVGLGAEDRARQAQFGQAALEIVPRLQARVPGAALGLALVRAQEDVPWEFLRVVHVRELYSDLWYAETEAVER
jgi:hypothetical protein